jgi:hypothetical protein
MENLQAHYRRPAVTGSLSTIIACGAPSFDPGEEIGSCPCGSEHMTGHLMLNLRDDLAFALWL